MATAIRKGSALYYGNFRYLRERKLGSGTIYWKCFRIGCRGRVVEFPSSGRFDVRNSEHICGYTELDKGQDMAMETLRERILAAEEGESAMEIFRKLLKELEPKVREVMKNDRQAILSNMRRWANRKGKKKIQFTFDDYFVEEGLEDEIPPPPPLKDSSSLDPQIKTEPVDENENDDVSNPSGPAGDSQEEKRPELIFLKGRSGDKHRVMINDKIYIFVKGLTNGGTLYKCQESKIGCKVTAKVFRGENQYYEIMGVHAHKLKTSQLQVPPKPIKMGGRYRNSSIGIQKLVDEEGRDLGNISVDRILTAGEDSSSFNLECKNLPGEVASRFNNSENEEDNSASERNQQQSDHLQNNDDNDNDNFDETCTGEDFPSMDFQDEDFGGSTNNPRTISSVSSNICNNKSNQTTQNARKSGEKCFACGDDLIVSETVKSFCFRETFRKACRYLNVRSEAVDDLSVETNFFCEPCSNEIRRIHQLYQKVEEIQSLIFKKVEKVEKRIADAVIVDNWLAEAPISALRLEGFRKQVLINYRNKLKLRREIRVGMKMGQRIKEMQPISSARMFASDPAETEAFRKTMPDQEESSYSKKTSSSAPSIPTRTSQRVRERRKSKTEEEKHLESQNMLQNVNESYQAEDDNSNFHDDTVGDIEFECNDFVDDDDNFVTETFERETKFWEEDVNLLRVRESTDVSNPAESMTNDNDGGDGSDQNYSEGKDDDDDDNSDDDWIKPKRRKRGAYKKKSKSSEPEKTSSEQAKPKKANHTKRFQYPKSVLTKDGRLFISSIEIIKNPPGLIPSYPGKISFSCGLCKRISSSFGKAREHVCGNHLGLFKCSICFQTLPNPFLFAQHERQKHSSEANLFEELTPCEICGKPLKGATNGKGMLYHRWSHLSEEEKKEPQYQNYCPPYKREKGSDRSKSLMCSYCPKEFLKLGALQNHEMTHTSQSGEGRTFQCQYCGRILKNRKRLHGHNEVCSAKKLQEGKGTKSLINYPCPKCPTRFSNRHTRAKHIKRFHRNVTDPTKPFCCPKCPRGFGTREAFKAHKKICTGTGVGSSASAVYQNEEFISESALSTNSVIIDEINHE